MSLTEKPKRYRFPSSIISCAIWQYHRFNLSIRDVQEQLAYRGIIVSHETIRNWCVKFSRQFKDVLQKQERKISDKWHLDEMSLRINGESFILWRAVDEQGMGTGCFLTETQKQGICYTVLKPVITSLLKSKSHCHG
ncbi:MAG TPA: hypothetical protein DIC42_03025 [Holosporales bacterium]|nr:hypothetical protein [Holosporales bacterium]